MLCRFGFGLLLLTVPAAAVVVRGKVTSPLGAAAAGARVQLIGLTGGARSVADTISGVDGAYEIRINLGGRFLLLTSPSINAQGLKPQIGEPFYAGRGDLLTLDVALDYAAITAQSSAQPTHIETPLRQLSGTTVQVSADALLTQSTPLEEIAAAPGAFVVQMGQTGAPAWLYLRGAPVAKTVIDGVSAEDLGGGFDLGTLTSGGLAAIASTPAIEITPTPNPPDGLDAGAGVLSLDTPRARAQHPTFIYTGDAGGLSTVHNEAVLSVAHVRTDALVGFSRMNTDNNLPAAPVHLISYWSDLGYYISGATSLRGTLRDDVSAAPLAVPFALYGIEPEGKRAAQNLVAAFTFETSTANRWHNLIRYGLARKRAEVFTFAPLTSGLPVTILGANRYSAAGIASFPTLPAREDFVTDRDEYTWQTDYSWTHFLTGLFAARYQDEQGADLLGVGSLREERKHISFAGSLQGGIRGRVFYQASGFLDYGMLLGVRGSPRIGLTYVPVRPGVRRFRGTSLHATVAAGVGEPALGVGGDPPRARTVDVGVEQSLIRQKLTLRASYFHNQFSHETERLTPLTVSNALAYRTQGLESELRYQPFSRLLVAGGYNYLAALVEQTAATETSNPNLPGVAIGALTALAGARPFHRPPNSGFFAVQVTGPVVTASLKASIAGRSDDSTNLYQNPALLLPNRNLSPGYISMDASLSYALARHLSVYTQLTNLLDDRHMAPIGYLSTPFLVRAGVRVRIGHE